MFKKVSLAGVVALILAGSSFFALHGSSSKAEAACNTNELNCILFNNINQSNSTSVFGIGPFFGGPIVTEPIFVVPVGVPVGVPVPIVTTAFPFFGFPFCARMGDSGFCPNLQAAEFFLAGGFSPFFFSPFFNQFLFP